MRATDERMTCPEIGSILAMALTIALVLFVLFWGELFLPGVWGR